MADLQARVEELWERRVSLRALSSAAATVDAVHALLLALVHLAGHHVAEDVDILIDHHGSGVAEPV